jgi:hypothetical protein
MASGTAGIVPLPEKTAAGVLVDDAESGSEGELQCRAGNDATSGPLFSRRFSRDHGFTTILDEKCWGICIEERGIREITG